MQFSERFRAGVFVAVLIATSIPRALLAQNPVHKGGFVEINAEIQILSWFGGLGAEHGPRPQSFQIHTVVGRDKWTICLLYPGETNFYSFDGARICECGHSFGTNGSTGNWRSWSCVASDGNPSATAGASDQLDLASRIAWLAFCSPPTLNDPNHKLYPPWEFWKEHLDPSKFNEKLDRFKDGLGLPKSLLIMSGDHQPVVDYRTSGTTNIAGCLIPQDFYLVEYNPTGDKGWMLVLLAHGSVSSIAQVANPVASNATAQVDYESQAYSTRRGQAPLTLPK